MSNHLAAVDDALRIGLSDIGQQEEKEVTIQTHRRKSVSGVVK